MKKTEFFKIFNDDKEYHAEFTANNLEKRKVVCLLDGTYVYAEKEDKVYKVKSYEIDTDGQGLRLIIGKGKAFFVPNDTNNRELIKNLQDIIDMQNAKENEGSSIIKNPVSVSQPEVKVDVLSDNKPVVKNKEEKEKMNVKKDEIATKLVKDLKDIEEERIREEKKKDLRERYKGKFQRVSEETGLYEIIQTEIKRRIDEAMKASKKLDAEKIYAIVNDVVQNLEVEEKYTRVLTKTPLNDVAKYAPIVKPEVGKIEKTTVRKVKLSKYLDLISANDESKKVEMLETFDSFAVKYVESLKKKLKNEEKKLKEQESFVPVEKRDLKYIQDRILDHLTNKKNGELTFLVTNKKDNGYSLHKGKSGKEYVIDFVDFSKVGTPVKAIKKDANEKDIKDKNGNPVYETIGQKISLVDVQNIGKKFEGGLPVYQVRLEGLYTSALVDFIEEREGVKLNGNDREEIEKFVNKIVSKDPTYINETQIASYVQKIAEIEDEQDRIIQANKFAEEFVKEHKEDLIKYARKIKEDTESVNEDALIKEWRGEFLSEAQKTNSESQNLVENDEVSAVKAATEEQNEIETPADTEAEEPVEAGPSIEDLEREETGRYIVEDGQIVDTFARPVNEDTENNAYIVNVDQNAGESDESIEENSTNINKEEETSQGENMREENVESSTSNTNKGPKGFTGFVKKHKFLSLCAAVVLAAGIVGVLPGNAKVEENFRDVAKNSNLNTVERTFDDVSAIENEGKKIIPTGVNVTDASGKTITQDKINNSNFLSKVYASDLNKNNGFVGWIRELAGEYKNARQSGVASKLGQMYAEDLFNAGALPVDVTKTADGKGYKASILKMNENDCPLESNGFVKGSNLDFVFAFNNAIGGFTCEVVTKEETINPGVGPNDTQTPEVDLSKTVSEYIINNMPEAQDLTVKYVPKLDKDGTIYALCQDGNGYDQKLVEVNYTAKDDNNDGKIDDEEKARGIETGEIKAYERFSQVLGDTVTADKYNSFESNFVTEYGLTGAGAEVFIDKAASEEVITNSKGESGRQVSGKALATDINGEASRLYDVTGKASFVISGKTATDEELYAEGLGVKNSRYVASSGEITVKNESSATVSALYDGRNL